ncbi:spore germination protein [Gorillibacterium sp. sgz5001074]|uniref:spore germination protein n=1 Tax=Gorillibacterium sp. sgz5001074 TaxID=3446695 RepID=UPI003F660C94
MTSDQTEHREYSILPEGLVPADVNDPDHPGTAKPSKQASIKEKSMSHQEQQLKDMDAIPDTMEEIKRALQEKVGLGVSFDLVLREMTFGSRKCGIFYVNGFAKDAALIEVLKRLTYTDSSDLKEHSIETLQEKLIPHNQVDKVEKFGDLIEKVLSGMTALFVEKAGAALVIDAKSYPVRSTQEPDLERVVRGSRDGFVETLMTNVALIRRRLRDPRLKFEIMKVGTRTRTDICIAYIQDIANPELIDGFRKKIKKVVLDGLPLGEKQLEEVLVNKNGWNPYPLVRYSERPDVVASHLLEGHAVLMADTSPSAMILPCSFFQLMQHAEEFRQTPAVGTYMRWVRYFGILASLFLLPLWYLMVAHPELKPPGMPWIGPQETGKLPVLVQFMIAELGIDMMRMAAIHTPTPLATAMGLIAAILVGQIAVETGMFVNEVIMYMAVATIGMFATPSYELSMANRLSRLFLLLAAAAFSIPGLVVAATIWLVLLTLQRSYQSPYMWPFIPFNAKACLTLLIRKPFGHGKKRPSLTQTLDSTRQPT